MNRTQSSLRRPSEEGTVNGQQHRPLRHRVFNAVEASAYLVLVSGYRVETPPTPIVETPTLRLIQAVTKIAGPFWHQTQQSTPTH